MSGALTPLPVGELTESDARYVKASRAKSTRRGYKTDWKAFTAWCEARGVAALPAAPETVTAYLEATVEGGLKAATAARRLSSIRSAHLVAGVPSPTDHPLVKLVWEGIRRTYREPPGKAPPLMPPVLWDVLAALPSGPVGVRDRAILLLGFVGALRRAEIAAARVEDLAVHPRGRVLTIPVSKTDQRGVGQVVVLPAGRAGRCPVEALDAWLTHLPEATGPLFRAAHRSGFRSRALSPSGVNRVVQTACTRVLGDHGYSAHSLRAGFVTYAASRGVSDRAIANQTRHESLASVTGYTRHESAWIDNAATLLDL